jgi:hypothetical protein
LRALRIPLGDWRRFWFLEGPPHALALFRLMLGLYWLGMWLPMAGKVNLFLSNDGFHFPLFQAAGLSLEARHIFGWMTQPVSPAAAWAIYGATLATTLLITVGLFTRVALALHLLATTYYWALHLHMLNSSFHRLDYVITFIMLWSPCNRALSVDSWLHRRAGDARFGAETALWSQRLVCMQIVMMYLGTGFFKMVSPAWTNGENLITSLMGDWASKAGFAILRWNLPVGIYDLLTAFIILFELYAVFMLFHPKRQVAFFVIGFVFHLVIAITLNIWPFMIMPMSYVLFVNPSRVKNWMHKAGRRLHARLGDRIWQGSAT